MTGAPFTGPDLRRQFRRELTANILPFWVLQAPDPINGGFYGALSNDLRAQNNVPRSAILCARILWTFSAAYRKWGAPEYLVAARYAYLYLTSAFLDPQNGGVYWSVDRKGKPVETRKHTYAQAFAIYGLTEYHRATGEPECLKRALEIASLIQAHTHDADQLGNLEARTRDWQPLADMRLSEHEPNSPKTMNTMLHLLEAYTNLVRVTGSEEIRTRLRETLAVFLGHILDLRTGHLRLFFSWDWQPEEHGISFGHDIEASWLLPEAALILGEENFIQRTRETAVLMADAVRTEACLPDGSLLNYRAPDGKTDSEKHWWAHAEAVVGFYNAFQISGREEFAEAAIRCWGYIGDHFVDSKNGDWFKALDENSRPLADRYKVGPWECPYHHARMCLEMIHRLPR